MPRPALAILAALFSLPGFAFGATLSPSLEQRLALLGPADPVPVILQLGDPVDLRRYRGGRSTARALILALRERAASKQAGVLAFLSGRPSVTAIRPLWINNSVAARVPAGLIAELQGLGEIDRIDLDEAVGFEEPAAGGGGVAEWSQAIIRADLVWNTYGLSGNGVVVGSMDTGFDPNHPALLGKWRGGTNSWIDIIGSMPAPYDDHGHGTHTVGTMVGGDGPGPAADDIGVAYGAKFISAKVLDATNSFSSASIVIAGAQWMLDPDGNPATDDFPSVINNSWFFFSPTYTGFYSTVAAWRAAGIVPVFCIGNSGPGAATTRVPASYENALGVGATTSADAIASFSSRGPSPGGPTFPIDLRKPDLSAPGQLVRSSIPGGGYDSWNGTSMAAPHVAGTVALMLEGNPSLDVDAIRTQLLASAADLGTAGYDYDFGYGRLDAFAATTMAVTAVGGLGDVAGSGLRCAPNPFRDRVRIDYAAASGPASIAVFDLAGRQVWSGAATGGRGTLTWDGRGRGGELLPSGVYLVRLRDGRSERTGRVLQLR